MFNKIYEITKSFNKKRSIAIRFEIQKCITRANSAAIRFYDALDFQRRQIIAMSELCPYVISLQISTELQTCAETNVANAGRGPGKCDRNTYIFNIYNIVDICNIFIT